MIVAGDGINRVAADKQVQTDEFGRGALYALNNQWRDLLATDFTFVNAHNIGYSPGQADQYFRPGDRLRITQNGVDSYFAVLVSQPGFLIIHGGTQNTFTSDTIEKIAMSRDLQPLGFPEWFRFDPATEADGGTYTPSSSEIGEFQVIGNLIHIQVDSEGTTTSDPTLFINLPALPLNYTAITTPIIRASSYEAGIFFGGVLWSDLGGFGAGSSGFKIVTSFIIDSANTILLYD